jgi:hypothetical protein
VSVPCTSQWGTPINCFELNSLPRLSEQRYLLLRDAGSHNRSVPPGFLMNQEFSQLLFAILQHLVCLFKCHVFCIFLLRSVFQIHYGTWNMSTLYNGIFT